MASVPRKGRAMRTKEPLVRLSRDEVFVRASFLQSDKSLSVPNAISKFFNALNDETFDPRRSRELLKVELDLPKRFRKRYLHVVQVRMPMRLEDLFLEKVSAGIDLYPGESIPCSVFFPSASPTPPAANAVPQSSISLKQPPNEASSSSSTVPASRRESPQYPPSPPAIPTTASDAVVHSAPSDNSVRVLSAASLSAPQITTGSTSGNVHPGPADDHIVAAPTTASSPSAAVIVAENGEDVHASVPDDFDSLFPVPSASSSAAAAITGVEDDAQLSNSGTAEAASSSAAASSSSGASSSTAAMPSASSSAASSSTSSSAAAYIIEPDHEPRVIDDPDFQESVYRVMLSSVRHLKIAKMFQDAGFQLPLFNPHNVPLPAPPMPALAPPPPVHVPAPVVAMPGPPPPPPPLALIPAPPPPAAPPMPIAATVASPAPHPAPAVPPSPPPPPAMTSLHHDPSSDVPVAPGQPVLADNAANSLLVTSSLSTTVDNVPSSNTHASSSTSLTSSPPMPTPQQPCGLPVLRGRKRDRPSGSNDDELIDETIGASTATVASSSQLGDTSIVNNPERNVRQRVRTRKPKVASREDRKGKGRADESPDEHCDGTTPTGPTQPTERNVEQRGQTRNGPAGQHRGEGHGLPARPAGMHTAASTSVPPLDASVSSPSSTTTGPATPAAATRKRQRVDEVPPPGRMKRPKKNRT